MEGVAGCEFVRRDSTEIREGCQAEPKDANEEVSGGSSGRRKRGTEQRTVGPSGRRAGELPSSARAPIRTKDEWFAF